MWGRIRYFLLYVFIFLLISGIIKDKVFDTPAMASKKVKKFMMGQVETDKPVRAIPLTKKITYSVYFYSILPMGKMCFEEEKEKGEFIYTLEVMTGDTWIKRFIEANASVQARLDGKTLLTNSYLEKTKVREKVKTKEIIFDHEKLIARRSDVKIKISKDTYDPVGAFIHAITASYIDQKVYEFKFLSKEEIYILKSTLISKKNDLYEICLEMFREDSSSSHGAHIYVWVTADEARIPVLFKSWMPAGYGSVVIDSVELYE